MPVSMACDVNWKILDKFGERISFKTVNAAMLNLGRIIVVGISQSLASFATFP